MIIVACSEERTLGNASTLRSCTNVARHCSYPHSVGGGDNDTLLYTSRAVEKEEVMCFMSNPLEDPDEVAKKVKKMLEDKYWAKNQEGKWVRVKKDIPKFFSDHPPVWLTEEEYRKQERGKDK